MVHIWDLRMGKVIKTRPNLVSKNECDAIKDLKLLEFDLGQKIYRFPTSLTLAENKLLILYSDHTATTISLTDNNQPDELPVLLDLFYPEQLRKLQASIKKPAQ